MNKFLFVLGSNWQLSLAELDNVLNYSQFKGRIVDYSANIAIVQFETLHDDKYYINRLMELQYLLGGTQKIIQIYDFIDIHTIFEAFPIRIEKFKKVEVLRKQIISHLNSNIKKVFRRIKNGNIFFAVSIYPNLYDEEYYREILVKHFLPFLNKEINQLLQEKGAKKTKYYKYPEKNIKSGNLNPIFPHHLIKYGLFNEDRAEIVFGFTEEGVYFGRTITSDDPNFKKKIDEERPYKEFKSSISPKLAIIMLNFLNLFEERQSQIVLDPFVGNGTILLFGTIEDFQVYGTDIDKQKVQNSMRNLNWLLKELEEPIPYLLSERILKLDVANLSSYFKEAYIDGICCEPELGPFYTQKPYYNEIKEFFEMKLTPLYDATFREAEKILKSKKRIVIVSPIISTVDGGDIQLNINNLARNYNFEQISLIDLNRIINKSNQKLQFKKEQVKALIDAKKDQILKRKIYVFEKRD